MGRIIHGGDGREEGGGGDGGGQGPGGRRRKEREGGTDEGEGGMTGRGREDGRTDGRIGRRLCAACGQGHPTAFAQGGVLPTVFVNTTQDRPAFESVHPSLGLIWDVVQGSSTLPRPRGAGGISQHTQGWSGAGRGSKRPWGIYVPPTGQKGIAICAWEMRHKPSSSV